LFCAYSLASTGLKIAVFDKGNLVENREKNEKLFGYGGAGTYSDGKLHLTPALSHEKLIDMVGLERYQKYLDYVDSIFVSQGVDAEIYPKDNIKITNFIEECKKKDITLINRKLRHVGSDKLPGIIKSFEEYLRGKKIELIEGVEIVDIIAKDGVVTGVIDRDKNEYHADCVVIAPGRGNSRWLQGLAEKHNLGQSYEKILVGARVEFPSDVLKKFSDEMYESVFIVKTHTYGDSVRTFCVCPSGYVATETYDGYVCANGHSNHEKLSGNSNFALLSEVRLTEPFGNTLEYGRFIANAFAKCSGNKPILQRLYDLKSGRRSTWERIEECPIVPSLKEVTPGDISLVMPARILQNLLEAIHKLESVLPGLDSSSTLLYAPEIKMNSTRIKTDNNLQTVIKGLYVAGDGAGVSGSITGAAASGLIVADALKENFIKE
jgi:uncharacterized FAD-dependent dehydrogenase